MIKIVVDSAIPFLEGVLDRFANVVRIEGKAIARDDVRDADALIIRTRTHCDSALLDGSSVKFIATATIGFDHIDLEYCRAHGIGVATAAGSNARGVLQWVGAVVAHFADHFGFTPQQRTIGIVGVGNVGRLVKEYAESWGFRTICCDSPRQQREGGDFMPLESLLPQADIVTLHTPLDASTRHMINAATIALMRPDALLINASRGEVVDTRALLDSGHACAIDVWEYEPEIDNDLLRHALIATPHIAGYSLQGKANASAMVVRAVAAQFGIPLTEWYPEGVVQSRCRPISWEQMCGTIKEYCDIVAETASLRRNAADFEGLRNGYHYREEYF